MIKIDDRTIVQAAKNEDVDESAIKTGLADGTIVIPKNKRREFTKVCAVGKGTKTKVNANIGVSHGYSDIDNELRKMEVAVSAGTDALMDLSTGPLLDELRSKILAECPVPLGTVPIYQIADDPSNKFLSMKEEDFIDTIGKQAEEGVDFFTIHAGVTYEAALKASKGLRQMGIVSRGGALMSSWMLKNKKENPFLANFDKILEVMKEYDVTLSLGDGLRPGAIADATDSLQVQELILLGELQKRAFDFGVQVIIEGPGHVPLDQIEANVKMEKSICNGAPFYVLGPLVTDSAPGWDHLVGAIGGAIAASYGADFLCYVTPAEHLRLPDMDDVKQGVIASKIAAHAADIVKGIPSAKKRDMDISEARSKRDWDKQFSLCLDPDLARSSRKRMLPDVDDVCTMCSDYCSIKIMEGCIKSETEKGEGK